MTSGLADDGARTGGRHRGRTATIVVVVVLVVLAALVVAAEFVIRNVADHVVAQQVEQALPSGSTGTVTADVHGIVLAQLVRGSLDDVDVDSDRLVVQGVPFAVHVTAHDVPLSGSGQTGAVTGSVRLTPAAITAAGVLSKLPGDVTLRNGGVGYTGSVTVIGLQLQYRVVAQLAASADGLGVVATPTSASIANRAQGFDYRLAVPRSVKQPITICTAKYLPEALRLEAIDITPAGATIDVRADHLPLSAAGIRTTGTCP